MGDMCILLTECVRLIELIEVGVLSAGEWEALPECALNSPLPILLLSRLPFHRPHQPSRFKATRQLCSPEFQHINAKYSPLRRLLSSNFIRDYDAQCPFFHRMRFLGRSNLRTF